MEITIEINVDGNTFRGFAKSFEMAQAELGRLERCITKLQKEDKEGEIPF